MSDNIVVGVRVRPPIAREEADRPAPLHWHITGTNTITQVDPANNNKVVAATPYAFDRVFGSEYGNEDVYAAVAQPIVESALTGFNGTVFAYGQTSSGKTYTMMGEKKNPGIIPLAIQNIFHTIQNTPDREYLIRVSYMEIYNENISDLIAEREKRGKSLSIREDTSGSVYVTDLKEECVNCEENLLALMRKGEKNRHVGVTNMNERSSRSHSIFRMIIESRERSEEDGVEEAVTVSHLNLVDLAGSENASQSGATGDRLKEGGFINKSLFMLGRVISQLSDGERHVNYRDSKLTRILQLSLGGNARTAIICTITPAAVEQTISTLRFASRAKSIKNKAIVNEVVSEAALLKRYAKEIKDLKRNLEHERKCDKAQEVEQVREMLDEEARKNLELLAKVNELKTKLIVSSLPRGKTPVVKKNRARRETWAAPAIAQAMRTSLAPIPFASNKMDLCFRRPELPPWTEHRNVSFGSSLSTDSPDKLSDCSITSDDFGTQDVSLVLNAAEQSKLACLETVFESPEPSNITTKRRRRKVKFDITPSPPTDTKEAACFTTTSPATPKREGMFSLAGTQTTPGTPAHVLRSRNLKLKEKLMVQDEWLSNWQEEMRDLQEFQKKEIRVLEESYENKIGNYKLLDPDVEQKQSLCQSLHDAQTLLMDANRALTERSQSNERLNHELEKVKEENERRGTCEQELITLRHQYNEIKKKYEDRESKLNQLENERNDFDMRMELKIAKQKQKEEDIRKSLEDAWQEIAAYEKSNMDEVKRRFQQNVELQKQLSDLSADADAQKKRMNEVISSLEQQLKESQVKQEAAEQESQLLRTQLQESQYLQNFETLDREESSPHHQSSQSISCKISETLQFLEESVMIPSTPGRSSVGGFLDEPLIQSNDLVVFIKQELINLQEALAQEQQNRSKPHHHHVTEYYNQVVAENERDTSVWTLQKAFTEDYILHSWTPHRSSSSHRQSDAFLNIEQDLQRATEDIRTKIRSEYEEKYRQEHEALEARLRQDTFVEGDTLYVPRHRSVGPQSLADELHQAGMNTNTTLDDTFETSLLDLNSVPQTWEMQQLKLQVELLMTENKELSSKVEELQKISNLHVEVKTPKEETNQKEQCSNREKQDEQYNVEVKTPNEEMNQKEQCSNREKQDEQYNVTCQQIEPLSLADELQECSMIITPCQGNSTLLTHTPESLSLKQQLPAVSEENKSLKDHLQQLQEGIECNNAKEEKPAEDGVIKQLQSDVEMMRNKNYAQETYVKKLEEELSCKNICEEEVHYLRWNVNTLKEEKSALEEELNLMQKEIDNLVLRENRVQTVTSTGVDKEDKVVQVTQTEGNNTEEQLRETAEELKKNLQTKTEELEDARKLLDSQKKTYDMIVGQINSVRDAFSAIREELGIETSKVEKNEDVVNESQDLSDLVITLSTLEERLQKRNEDLNTLKEQLNEKTLDLNTMKEQLNEKTLDLNTLKEQLNEKTLDLNTLKEQLNEKTLDLNTMKEQLNEKTLDLNTMKEQLNEKTLDLNTMKEQLNDRTVTLQAAYENIDSLKNELYMRTISAENGSDCTEEQKQNQANLDCALERIERLVKEQEEQRLSYENRLAQVVGEKDCELEEIITNFTEKEEAFEEKVKELEDIVKESVNIRESVEEKDKQLQSHLKDISSLQTKIQDLELALSAKCDDYSALKECNSELQSNFSQLQLQHDNDKQNIERTVDMYKEKLDLKIQEFTDLLKVYEEQKKLLHAAESELELLKAKPSKEMETPSNNSILTETHEVSSVLDQSIIDQKLDELESLRNKYAGQIDECSKLRDTVDNLKIMLSKKEEELKQVLLEHKNETESRIEELCKRDEDINDMEIKIATSNEEVTRLKCCVEAKDHKLERLQREMTKVEENLQASNEVKESFEMKLDIEKSSKIQELQTDLEHLNKTYEEVCSDRKNMVIAINEEKEAKEHLEYECQTLKMKLENLEEDYLYIRDELTLKETEITNKSESLSSLEVELQMLQEEMATLSNKKLELIDEQILENKKIEKLIGDIEKYETEMSEKDEQLIKLKHNLSETVTKHSEMEELVKTMQATNSEMASKLKGMEEKESSSISFEEKLMIAEQKLFTMQNDHKEKVAELERCLLDSYSQKENLGIKLAETEEQYKLFSKELEVKIGEIEEKNLILLQLSTENEHLKLELQALGQEISHADVLLKTTETEKINLEEELSLSKTSENNMKEQLEANSCEIDKLVTLVEKYETEMSEKDEQMLCQTKEYEAEIASKEKQVLELNVEIERNNAIITRAKDEFNAQQRNLEEKMKLHINKIEELKKKCSDFENDIARQTTSSTSLKTLMEELASAEDKYAILQADFNTRVKNHTEDNNTYLLEKEQLLSMLKQKEEELNCVCEKNTELDAEMDDMVKHYKNENNVNLEQQQQLACKLTRVEKELSLTKAKLKEAMSCTSAASPLKPEASGELDEQKSLREDIAQLRKELQEKQDALARKEEECKALDDEIEDAVKHYTKENERVWQHCELITTQLTTTQMELSETKTKLLEISQLEKTHVSERVVNSKDIQKDDLIEKEILENENKTIRSQCVALEAAAGRYKEKINEISQTVDTLQTELRVSGKTVNTLMERIGDHEKLRDIYEREKKDKEKQVKELENTITMLKKVAGNEDESLDKTEELLRRVHHLEEKLEINIQKYNSLAEEHSKYKLEYNRLFKESEQYKALLSKGELMKEDLERKNQDLTTHVNTLTNSFMASETSGKDYPVSARKKKISTLEKEQDSLKLEYAKLVVKLNETEAVLDSLRRNQGVVSDNESFQRELTWMKEKMEELERERTLLNTNYDSLEQDYQVLQKEVEELHKQLTVARNTQPTPTMLPTPEISVHSSMSSESTHEERNDLKQNTNSSESSINEGEDMRSLRERLIKVEREKNEMKLKQRALNAPAEKKLRLTEEELRIANGKVASLRQELRRVQASKYVMDSTVCEMNTKTPGARNQPKIEYDYNTGSGVVLELQVLDLKNRVYHIEKENKEQDFKIQILEQDKDHYKKKAEEWKLNCLKEKKIMQKVRKELELKEQEIQQYHTVLEDKGSLLEQRQFELGYQREKIEKLEREKNEKLEREKVEKIESERQPRQPSATQHNPGNILPSSPKKDGDQTDAGSQEISSRGDAQQLGIHNNTRTRVERLPGARQTAQDLDKVPMWQSMDKENKDYSKYYLPRQSNKGLEDENCKTQ